MSKKTNPDELKIGLVSVSDRASSGVYQDEGIPALQVSAEVNQACSACLLYTSPSPRDVEESRMPSSA